mmetsp:Transcript_58968/g.132826  ORF Transcript_58968/g.132826 Transcript_58968/m.132826 type:complete len:183 (+) Transcript_58968:2-550(+)
MDQAPLHVADAAAQEGEKAVKEEPEAAVDAPALKAGQSSARCVMREERRDLFEVDSDFSLCHCVSKDLSMSAGIAVQFKKQFGGVDQLSAQQAQVGGMAVLKKGDRYIYNLVTKNKFSGKPCMSSLEASLRAMKAHIVEHGVHKLAMPKIGCGLDKLSWGAVSGTLLYVFDDCDIELLVCSI